MESKLIPPPPCPSGEPAGFLRAKEVKLVIINKLVRKFLISLANDL